MNKNALILSAFLTTTLATGLVVVHLAEYACNLPALLKPSIEEQAVKERWTTYWCFKRTLESTQRALENGDMRLEEAYPQVVEAARRYCPVYLNKLGFVERGDTDEERVARNLIRYLHLKR